MEGERKSQERHEATKRRNQRGEEEGEEEEKDITIGTHHGKAIVRSEALSAAALGGKLKGRVDEPTVVRFGPGREDVDVLRFGGGAGGGDAFPQILHEKVVGDQTGHGLQKTALVCDVVEDRN